MGYVLVNSETGKYVAPAGSEHSYTRSLQRARIYPTREAAVGDSCGNEIAQSVDDILRGRR